MQAASEPSPLTIWTMTSGGAGMKSQVNGLANAIALKIPVDIIEKTIALKWWAKPLPGHLTPCPLKSTRPPLTPPWPDLLITSGRRTSAASIAIGRASNGKTYRVHLQNPQTPLHHFDLVCPMAHDQLHNDQTAPTNLTTTTALHKITTQDLTNAAAEWAPIWQQRLNREGRGPILGILLGGKNKNAGFDQTRCNALIKLIHRAINEQDAEVFITPSNRTEAFVIKSLRQEFSNHANVWIWDQTGKNPYHAILATADHLLVTSDSVSMISESLYTDRPVHIFPLSNIRRRHRLFLDILAKEQQIQTAATEVNFSVKSSRPPID